MSLTQTTNEIKIMIGIPSFKRPQLLAKALENLNKQTYKKFKVLVSVNGNDKDIKSYQDLEKMNTYNFNLQFHYQNKEIDVLKNFFFLLKECEHEYFMWLADDDLISPSCLENLIDLLENDKDSVTAVPVWELVDKNKKKKIFIPSHFHQNSCLMRIINYCDVSDDAFFYGLHKTENLKKCSFKGFWKPNSKLISRWAYVYLFDLIVQGKILFDSEQKAKWINHNSEVKHYEKNSTKPIRGRFENYIKTININYFYLAKIIKWKKIHYLPLIIPILLYFFIRDLILGQKIYKKINF